MENQEQFHRSYKLIIGQPNRNRGLEIIGDERNETGVQLKFSVKKFLNNAEKSNEATIDIYNLSEDSINYIQRPDTVVFLYVGYNNDNKLLFRGIVKEIDTDDRGTRNDRKTSLRCVPSESFTYSPEISKTFPANTSPRQIVNFLVGQSTTLTKASFNSTSINERFPFGYSVQGTPKEILNDLSRDFGFNYAIDGQRIYVSDPDKYQTPNSTSRAIVFTPNTGLKGVPSYASPDGKTNKDAVDRKSGVKFTGLINASVQPGKAVVLKETVINGLYRVNTIEFKGDWRSSSTWDMECWCSKLSGNEV